MANIELRAYLRGARARVNADEPALSRRDGRRVRGLRAADVAELVGISEAWYSRFERGKARLSLRALCRLADVLRLAPQERRQLFALSRPELRGYWSTLD